MKNEIAITRRATYKAEEAVQQLEKEKGKQDDLIDKLQENLKTLHQAATLRAAQVCSCVTRIRSRACSDACIRSACCAKMHVMDVPVLQFTRLVAEQCSISIL